MISKAPVHLDHRTYRKPAGYLLIGLALSALLTARAPEAAAAPVTATSSQTLTIGPLPTDWQTATASRPARPTSITPLLFDKFDPSLGDLLSVTISAKGTFQHQVSMTFVSPSTITVTAEGNRGIVTLPDGSHQLTIMAPDDPVTQTYNGPTFPKTIQPAPTTVNGTAGPLVLTSPADLAMFKAVATGEKIDLPANAAARSSFFSDSGNGSGSVTTRAAVEVTVTYEYAVPEPSTFAAFGVVALTLVAVRRRRAA
ncbi:MAG: PEP-CTERM sorting domain-containing protein [Isosphaeraceae bacterium]